jgi:ATP-dependent Clp protease ATP-binding subunit ClpA
MHINPFLFDDEDDIASKAFLDTIKNFRGKFPKVDENDLPISGNAKEKPDVKSKQITKQKFLGLEPYLKNNIIGQEHAVSALINA